jgi:hypothetical protein
MRKKRPFDGFMGWKISHSRIGLIFNFKAVFIFKFLYSYAQPVYLWGAHASRSLHLLLSNVLSGTWGPLELLSWGVPPGEHCSRRGLSSC